METRLTNYNFRHNIPTIKRTIVLFLIVLTLSFDCIAQKQAIPPKKAIELFNDWQHVDAVDYFYQKVQEQNDHKGYNHIYSAHIYLLNGMYSEALKCVNNAIKIIPTQDKSWFSNAYAERGDVYLYLKDTLKAINDWNKAISIDKSNVYPYKKLGIIYRDNGFYTQAEKYFSQIVEIDNTNPTGYYGLAGVSILQNKFEKAIEQLSQAIKIEPTASHAYTLRAIAYLQLEKYNEATDDIVSSLDINFDDHTYNLMMNMKGRPLQLLKSKLLKQSTKSPNKFMYLYYLGDIATNEHHYKSAIQYYKKCYQLANGTFLLSNIADTYSELGDYEDALKYVSLAIEKDTFADNLLITKAKILNEMGQTELAIKLADKYIEAYPDYFYGYYCRAWFKDGMRDIQGAMYDYTVAITLNPGYAYTYVNRGNLYLEEGNDELAEKDFYKNIELDSVFGCNNSAMYSYFCLGETEKAKQYMDSCLSYCDEYGVYYEAACLYSLLQEKDKALNYLEKSLERGYRRLKHMEIDVDLKNIQGEQRFKDLLTKYTAIAEEENSHND
jgi:tetratricopeptide (TPR) repeat protein